MHRKTGVCANGNFSIPMPCWGLKGGRDVFPSKSHLQDEFEHELGSELRVSSWTSFCPAGRMSSGADFPDSFVICFLTALCLYCANSEILLCRLHQSAQLQAKKITGKNKQPKLSRDTGRCTKPRWDSPVREQQGHPPLNLILTLASIHTSWKILLAGVWQGLGQVFSVSFDYWENLANLY